MKILLASKYKIMIEDYGKLSNKNLYVYAHCRGIYDSRLFGLVIIRNIKAFNKLK